MTIVRRFFNGPDARCVYVWRKTLMAPIPENRRWVVWTAQYGAKNVTREEAAATILRHRSLGQITGYSIMDILING